MKKIYASLAVAALVSAGVSAARVDQSAAQLQNFTRTSEATSVVYGSDMSKAPAKEAISQANVSPIYIFHNNEQREEHPTMITIDFDGPKAGDLNGENCTIYGLWSAYGYRAVFNESTGTFRIYSQSTGVTNTYYNEEFWIYTMKWATSSTLADIAYQEFEYLAEGAQLTYNDGTKVTVSKDAFFPTNFNDSPCLFVTIPSMHGTTSGFAALQQIWWETTTTQYPASEFEYKESDWEAIGNAQLSDGWFAPVMEGDVQAYSVPAFRNKANPNEIMLKNPYGTDTPFRNVNNAADTDGMIILEVVSEEVDGEELSTVVVRPFITNGCQIDFFYNGILCCGNVEGSKYYLDESTIEDIMYDLDDLKMTMSSVSEDGKTLSLPNCRIQCPGEDANVLYQYTFHDNQGNVSEILDMVSTIVLPAAVGGVEGVLNDAEAGEARYFNLQGMEVANPEAGQLVIKSQGGKSTKMIVR